MAVFLNQFSQQSQCAFTVTEYRHIHRNILSNFRRINIQMNNFRLFGISIQLPGYTIVKAHTNGNQHITFICFYIRPQVSVHSQHSLIQVMSGRQCRKSQQRTTARDVCFLHKFLQFLLGISKFYSLPYQHQRLLRFID